MSLDDTIDSKLLWSHSVWAGCAPSDSRQTPAKVWIIPPSQPLEQAAPLLQEAVRQDKEIWVFGHGVTLPQVSDQFSNGVYLLTELGVLGADPEAFTRERKALMRTLRHLCRKAHTLSRLPLLACCAYTRFLQTVFEAAPYSQSIDCLHREKTVKFTSQDWLVCQTVSAPKDETPVWRAHLLALGFAGLLASLIRVAKEAWQRRDLMRNVRQRRKQGSHLNPKSWVMTHHEWYELNPYVIDNIALPWLAEELPLGVLLTGELLPGHRDHFTLERKGNEYFAGLAPLRGFESKIKLEQCVVPETFFGWLQALGRVTRDSLSLLIYCASGPKEWKGDSLRISLPLHIQQLARLFSIDILRAGLAEVATEEAGRRSLSSPAPIFSLGSADATTIGADLSLQEQGHQTIDFCHGGGLENQPPFQHSASSHCLVWLENDARYLQELGSNAFAGGMPTRVSRAQVSSSPPWKLLLCSAYVHRDTQIGDFFPNSQLNQYFASLAQFLQERRPGQYQVRWRPHPADSPQEVRRSLEGLTVQPELSANRSLPEDLAWADGVVSGMSSAIFEALLAELPTFVHCPPRFAQTSYIRSLHPDRLFYYFEQLLPALDLTYQLGQTPDLQYEHLAKKNFFGPSGRPRTTEDIWQWAGLLEFTHPQKVEFG